MKIAISQSVPSTIETPLLVLAIADNGDKTPLPELLAVDPALQALAAPLIAAADLTGKFVEPIWDLSPAGISAQRILFLGAGKRDKFSLSQLRNLAGAAARAAKSKNIKSFVLVLPELFELSAAAQAAVEGIVAGDFDVDTYRSDRKDQLLTDVTLSIPAKADAGAVFQAIAEGAILAESQNFTRTLALEPSNLMTPSILAEHARAMCEEVGLACEVYGPDKLKELKMGAFLSVSQGSEEEPRLVVMRYEPATAAAGPVLGLVGKGITFDSGGISIKPADGMEKMKYDMCGAATMIGAMRAIALLKPNVRVISVLCCSENMPDGKAQKPGDVQFAMNGKSIEIINTDAEGRLVLADGLCYARQLGATHLIDAATLTGAVVVALGYHNVGVFTNNDGFAGELMQSAQRTGEKMWIMPVDADYFDHIRSEIADIKNTGGRWGGATTAAMFLKEFVDDTPWIHLDIAGTAWLEENKAWMPKGPSGVAVRTLVDFARHFQSNHSK
jgi:leucyl aminopeptidase